MALLARSLRSAFTTGIQVARKSWTQPAVVCIQHQLAYHNNGFSSTSHANTSGEIAANDRWEAYKVIV